MNIFKNILPSRRTASLPPWGDGRGAVIGSVFLFLLLLTFSLIAPWVGDDVEYAYVASAEVQGMTDEPITSLADVLRSQVNHYQATNGRSVAHLLVQCFCGLWGRVPFALANGLMAAVFFLLVVRAGGVRRGDGQKTFLALLLTLTPFYLYYTPCTQIGFVWMSCLALGALLFVERPPRSARWCVLLFLFGVLAGWGQEAISFGLCGGLWFGALLGRVRGANAWCVLVGLTLGCLILGLSPGAWQRAAGVSVSLADSLVMMALRLRTFYLLLLLLFYLWFRGKETPWGFFRREPVLCMALLLALGFNLLIGVVGARQLFGIEVFSMLLILRALTAETASSPVVPSHLSFAIGLLTFALTFTLLKRADYLWQTRQAYDRTMTLARHAPDGALVLHRFTGGDALWPGQQFLDTMAKQVRTETHRTIRIVPASIVE